MSRATAIAHPNIAVVKYWGKRDVALNLPAVPSLSLTLGHYRTRTTVEWGIDARGDEIRLNGKPLCGRAAERVSRFLDRVAPERPRCRVVSDNNFPTAAGLASSSSGFAALALAASAAAGQRRERAELSALARQGSGSACRSLWGGWVEWRMGCAADGSDSHGVPVAPADHWDVRMVVAMVGAGPKPVGSTEAMIRTQRTSPLYRGWVDSAAADVRAGRAAVLDRDLAALGEVMEHSTAKMHATMLSARPSIRYWKPQTVAVLDAVEALRRAGTGAWATVDAGPNVKVLCAAIDAEVVAGRLIELLGPDRVVVLGPGGDARLV